MTNLPDIGFHCRRDNNQQLAYYISTHVFFKENRSSNHAIEELGPSRPPYLLTLSPCAVDSLNPSYRHTVTLDVLRFLTTSHSSSRPIPVPASISSTHLFHGRPHLLYPSPHANIISISRPSALITSPKEHNFCYMMGYESLIVAEIPIPLH